jgi:hypothetical protein
MRHDASLKTRASPTQSPTPSLAQRMQQRGRHDAYVAAVLPGEACESKGFRARLDYDTCRSTARLRPSWDTEQQQR